MKNLTFEDYVDIELTLVPTILAVSLLDVTEVMNEPDYVDVHYGNDDLPYLKYMTLRVHKAHLKSFIGE